MDEDFDDDDEDVGYEYDDDEEGGEEDADDNDGEEEMVPFEEMKKCLEKKPKGFGEGKVYDTSIEDKLLEEMRLSKEAQAANLEKLKSNPVNLASKKLKSIPPSYLLLPLLRLHREVYEGLRQKASSLLIQRYFRMHIARKAYKELYTSIVSIQTGMRVMAARCELHFRRRTSAAIVIQSHCRKYMAQLHFTKLKKASITTQCAWRGKVARRELRKLNMVDMEEAKAKENERLQSSLQEMQLQLKETKLLLEKERETTKRMVERVPVIQEVPVVDHALLDKLSSENEKLKNLVSSLEKKIDETGKRYEEANKISEERLKQALDAE